jgi:hypothetical protein
MTQRLASLDVSETLELIGWGKITTINIYFILVRCRTPSRTLCAVPLAYNGWAVSLSCYVRSQFILRTKEDFFSLVVFDGRH